jgi:hypothetical protein
MNDNEIDNVVEFPSLDSQPYSLRDIIDDLEAEDVSEVFVIARASDGDVLIYSTAGAEAADKLLEDGTKEFENLLEYTEDGE